MSRSAQKLRSRLEDDLGRTLSAANWAKILRRHDDLGLGDVDGGYDSLKDYAEGLLEGERSPNLRGRGGKSDYSIPARLLPHEEKRLKITADVVAAMAALDPAIVRFRELYLPASPLSAGDAMAFLKSPVYRLRSRAEIERAGLPARGLLATEETPQAEGRWWHETMPDGKLISALKHVLHCEWGSSERRTIEFFLPYGPEVEAYREVKWKPPGPREVEVTRCLPGSVLDELRSIAQDLAWRCWWTEPEAAWFVLTGTVPAATIVVDITRREATEITQAMVTLRVPPWISAETVKSAYAYAQRWTLGRPPRRISERSLERFAFVRQARSRSEKSSATWASLTQDWLGKSERADWQRLQRDYKRTERTLLRPVLAMGEDVKALDRWALLTRKLSRLDDIIERHIVAGTASRSLEARKKHVALLKELVALGKQRQRQQAAGAAS